MKIDLSQIKEKQQPKQRTAGSGLLSKEIHLFHSQKLSHRFFQKFYQGLHDLLASGLDLMTAFEIIKNQHKKKEKAALSHLQEALSVGLFLSDAVASSRSFNHYDTHLLRIAEKTGSLIVILKELENYYATKIKLRRMWVGALTYPALVVAESFGVLYFMLAFLIPTFKDIYLKMDVALPAVTQLMLNVSESFSNYTLVFPLFILLGFVAYLLTKSNKALKAKAQMLLLKAPWIGKIALQVQLMRFSHSMYLLLDSKIPITEALTLSARLSSFLPFVDEVEKIKSQIIQGSTLSAIFETSEFFDARYSAMIRVGEQTATLSKVFQQLFEQKMTQMNLLIKMTSDLLEPILILVIGGLVALVLVAMYLPMFGLSF